ncbi:hypothetical protein PAXRUDRAFT_20439 [Paxillus rubicundulus Ve08.2h10]|uniref:Uncharacterized protein n=1 Tax=Paxillus rubicundulus Ve08.2h10 TaxID=930991 RepID=A0A0D0CE81_9AGAM|nr:hypothetical protein PAXRUDRAFT_20439 [Paxillus rubicundulus Ve08.2h10]
MSKEFMDQINVWATEQLRPLSNRSRSYTNVVNGLLLSSHTTPVELSLEERTYLTRMLEMLTFSTAAWNLWTRCFELVKLKRKDLTIAATSKGWQQHVDKGKETDLRCNRYKIYLQPDLPSCDCFYWLLLWISFVELVHYHRPLDPDDYVIPAMGAAGIMQPHEPLSHDTVQSWIDEAVSGTKIAVLNGGKFTTHTYRRGGAQYRYMFAPVGKRFTLAKVCWWGGWAKNKHRDTMIRYLLDELHAYETDHGDALCPIQREANVSLLGEHTLVKPATTEDCLPLLTPSSDSSLPSTTSQVVTNQGPPPGSQHKWRSHKVSRALPTKDLIIPDVPVVNGDGTQQHRRDSWREIIKQWVEGDPKQGLVVPLREWPPEWYQGANKSLFTMKRHNRGLIAWEFIDHYNSNEQCFLDAYPQAANGHTALLRAIKRAMKQRGETIPRQRATTQDTLRHPSHSSDSPSMPSSSSATPSPGPQ